MGDDEPRPEAPDSHAQSGPDQRAREELPPDELDARRDGGDPVCWLERVCDRCGGLSDGPPAPRCDRCGAPAR